MRAETSKNFALLIIGVAFVVFLFLTYKALMIADKRQIATDEGIYTNHVTTDAQIKTLAHRLVEGCHKRSCQVERVLDYVTAIPYKINRFQAHSPQRTIQENYGDCDDKSNLLVSMLHALGIEAYFVLVPKHIFIIVPLEEKRLDSVPGLWIDGRKFYILESTAKGSSIGFPLHYRLDEIEAIIDPFENKRITFEQISYKP
jgi:transglutaminase-like putative cysteine protease